jgi:hypothetical protein
VKVILDPFWFGLTNPWQSHHPWGKSEDKLLHIWTYFWQFLSHNKTNALTPAVWCLTDKKVKVQLPVFPPLFNALERHVTTDECIKVIQYMVLQIYSRTGHVRDSIKTITVLNFIIISKALR